MRCQLLVWSMLLHVGLLLAQPATPHVEIQRGDSAEDSFILQWDSLPGFDCYEVRQSRDCASYRFLGHSTATAVVLHPRPQPWVERQLRCYQVLALDNCLPTVAPPNDMLAWFPLDGSGSDATGHGWDLAPVNVFWVDGRFGQAAELNGVDAYLERFESTALCPNLTGWTVSAWVAAIDIPLEGAIVSWYRCGANSNCNAFSDASLYRLTVQPGERFQWDMRDYGGQQCVLTDAEAACDLNWHHVVGTFSETDHHTRLYVDGNQLPDFDACLINQLDGSPVTVPFSIGRVFRMGWAEPHLYLRGRVDDLRIYARALSLDEVRVLYEADGWPFAAR